MKVGNKVLIKATNEIAIIEKTFSNKKIVGYYARTGGVLKCLFEHEMVLLSDIAMLDEYKEVGSDIIYTGEDSEGTLLSVTIPTADIANYFETEELEINKEADYQGAGQNVFNNWIDSPGDYDIEIELK